MAFGVVGVTAPAASRMSSRRSLPAWLDCTAPALRRSVAAPCDAVRARPSCSFSTARSPLRRSSFATRASDGPSGRPDESPGTSSRSSSANPSDPASTNAGSSLGDMAQDALKKLNSETLDLKEALGDQAYGMLKEALGEDKMTKIEGVLNPILANRRAITVASAVIDVALIFAGIKFVQGVVTGGGDGN